MLGVSVVWVLVKGAFTQCGGLVSVCTDMMRSGWYFSVCGLIFASLLPLEPLTEQTQNRTNFFPTPPFGTLMAYLLPLF